MNVASVARRARTENFPVASVLFPRRLRPHLRAVYGFARLVDILGDELEADRLAALDELEREAGLASGLINTSQQIGGAIGTAIASTIFISHFKSLRIEGKSFAEAHTGGYAWAFWGLAVIGVLALIAALTLIRREEMAEVPSAAPIG